MILHKIKISLKLSVILEQKYLSNILMKVVSEGGRAREDCNICAIRYNREDRIPTFICINNHTTCKKCFDELQGKKSNCPFCRALINDGELRVNNDIFWQLSSLSEQLEKEKDEILRKNKDAEKKIFGLNLEKEQYKRKIQQFKLQQSVQKIKIDDLNDQVKSEKQRNGVFRKMLLQNAEKQRVQKEKKKKEKDIFEEKWGFFRSWLLPLVIFIHQNFKNIISFCYGAFLVSQFLFGLLSFLIYLGQIIMVWDKKITFLDFSIIWFWLIWGCLEVIGGMKMTDIKNQTIFQRRKAEQTFYYVGNVLIFSMLWIGNKNSSPILSIYMWTKIIDTSILLILSNWNPVEDRQNGARDE